MRNFFVFLVEIFRSDLDLFKIDEPTKGWIEQLIDLLSSLNASSTNDAVVQGDMYLGQDLIRGRRMAMSKAAVTTNVASLNHTLGRYAKKASEMKGLTVHWTGTTYKP